MDCKNCLRRNSLINSIESAVKRNMLLSLLSVSMDEERNNSENDETDHEEKKKKEKSVDNKKLSKPVRVRAKKRKIAATS